MRRMTGKALFIAGLICFLPNLAFAQGKLKISSATIRTDGNVVVKTISDSHFTYVTNVRNVKVVLDTELDGTYIEVKLKAGEYIYDGSYLRLRLAQEMNIYVRSVEVQLGWELVLNKVRRDLYEPHDVLPVIQ